MVIKDAGLGTRRCTATSRNKREERMERAWVEGGGEREGTRDGKGYRTRPLHADAPPSHPTSEDTHDGLYVPAECT